MRDNMGVKKDLKAFANEHPVVAVVVGGVATFYVLGLFGYGFIGGKVADAEIKGINGYHTW